MDSEEFKSLRIKLNKTQSELALLLGTSLKAIRSYEQGWRNIPAHAERQLYLLVSTKNVANKKQRPCWVIKKCPLKRKRQCPAWEFRAGTLCWVINGTICEGVIQRNWNEKMEICQSCEVWNSLIRDGPHDI